MRSFSFSTVLLLLAGSCATLPAVSTDELKLNRVIIYRNGVAYFERAGQVKGNQIRFKVRGDEVGDFLASFAVTEKGGSSVRTASFPLRREEPSTPAPPDPVKLEPADPKRRMETVVMELDGKKHELSVGYIAEAPIWRPSYRLVLGKGPAHLQLWGIVQNQSGEDWKDVDLTLVADAPLALTTQLEKPIIPYRPVLSDDGGVFAVIPQAETNLAEIPPAPSAHSAGMSLSGSGPMATQMVQGRASLRPEKKAVARRSKEALSSERSEEVAEASDVPMPAPQALAPSKPRNLAALAAVAVTGGSTRYRLPNRVTIPHDSATMVLLSHREIPGESTYLFAPDGAIPDSQGHPFRVARFTNTTGGLLERGPLAFFGEGGFLGQGVIDPLPDGASATVPFGLERGLAVNSSREPMEEDVRLFQIEMGRLIVQIKSGPRTKYIVKSGHAEKIRLWIKHPRQPATDLIGPPSGTADNVSTKTALLPVDVPALAKQEFFVNERRWDQRETHWFTTLAEKAVNQYLAGKDEKGDAQARLRVAWGLRNEWKNLSDLSKRLTVEQNTLQTSTEETRQNLKAIEKNKSADDLRKTLTSRLSKDSARLDQVTKRLVEAAVQEKELELRFQEAIQGVTIPPRS